MDLFTEASRDLEAEHTSLRMAHAKVAVAGLWPFLTLAQSEREFEHRLALANDHIGEHVPADLMEPVLASLREDFRLVREALGADGTGQMPENGQDAAQAAAPVAPTSGNANTPTPGGAAPGAGAGTNTPQTPDNKNQMSVNTPMTASKKDDEDEGDDDGDGKPPWLKKKIDNPKEGAVYFHAGQGRYVTAKEYNDDPNVWDEHEDDTPTRAEAEEDSKRDRHERRQGTDPYPNQRFYSDPWGEHSASRQGAYFHAGLNRWVTAAISEPDQPGGGNPYYFTGGPEAGPNTGQTNQFPPHPTGQDPVDPINQMFPMQPSPWTVPPGGEWKEVPMNFNPPLGGHQGSRHPFVAGRGGNTHVHRPGDIVDYYQSIHDDEPVRGAEVVYGANHPEYGNHYKVKRSDGSSDLALAEYTHRTAAGRYVDEGVETGPPGGKNPYYFSGGGEGVQGDQSDGFPADQAQGVDPHNPLDEWYGQSPVSGGMVDNGNHVAYRRTAKDNATPDNPAPDSDKLLGTEFDSSEERERWNKAERGEQQGSRASFAGSRRGFFDPNDPGVHTLRLATVEGAEPGDPAGAADVTSEGQPWQINPANPETTKPRQMPGDGGGNPFGGGDAFGNGADDSEQKIAMIYAGNGQSYERATDSDPTGAGDEYDHNTWDGPMRTRPRQDAGQRGVNTPQTRRDPIPTVSSPDNSPGNQDEQREASRVAQAIVQQMVGAR